MSNLTEQQIRRFKPEYHVVRKGSNRSTGIMKSYSKSKAEELAESLSKLGDYGDFEVKEVIDEDP